MTHVQHVPLVFLWAILAVGTLAQAPAVPAFPSASPSLRPEILSWDQGEAGLHLLFKRLKTTGRLMQLTAHPDDEDGAMLTLQSRGHGQQVLLMTLTRGEGGQNRTGSNLWDELGVLRTLELLESGRYYGVEQRFSRVADFGYSKSAEETFKKWGGHEVPLRDIVYVIRAWKPDVLTSRFSGTERDGHGNHQAAGILAPEAVKCAADPTCFPDQLKNGLATWQVLKLYMGNQGLNADYTVRLDASQVDPDAKMSYAQMALEGFRHQASQLSGDFKLPSGPLWRPYKLVYSALAKKPGPGEHEQDFFDGIDTSLAGLANRYATPESRESMLTSLQRVASLIDDAIAERKPQLLLKAQSLLRNDSPALQQGRDVLADKLEQLQSAANQMLDLRVEATTGQRQIVPGMDFQVAVKMTNHGTVPVSIEGLTVGSDVMRDRTPQDRSSLAPNSDRMFTRSLKLPLAAPVTKQHWTRKNPETDTVYTFLSDDPRIATLPFVSSPFIAISKFAMGTERGAISAPVTAVQSKKTAIAVVSPISILFDAAQEIRSQTEKSFLTSITVRSVAANGPVELSIVVPEGWYVSPARQTLLLSAGTERKSAPFKVVPAAAASGQQIIRAQASFNSKVYEEGFSVVTRDDLDTFYYYQPAMQRVSLVNVNVPKSLRVGYLPGAGDDIFPVLQQLGLDARMLSTEELAQGDLHGYDTIVVGIRGYDERPEIRANNHRLLDFVKDGGTLIVQNQKAEEVFNSGKFAPYSLTLGRERVSVEEAPVELLAPDDPIFNAPNKIARADFDDWVQERGVNFIAQWAPEYQPLLASADPGEQPLKGGLLRAKFGKGTYIYTGYAFFRQLPAGVPGAVRLYVNLLNAGHDAK